MATRGRPARPRRPGRVGSRSAPPDADDRKAQADDREDEADDGPPGIAGHEPGSRQDARALGDPDESDGGEHEARKHPSAHRYLRVIAPVASYPPWTNGRGRPTRAPGGRAARG